MMIFKLNKAKQDYSIPKIFLLKSNTVQRVTTIARF